MTLSNLTGRADVGTSEFDLKIGVCFVENGSFFENGSLKKKKKKREVYIEDSCREVSSCKRNIHWFLDKELLYLNPVVILLGRAESCSDIKRGRGKLNWLQGFRSSTLLQRNQLDKSLLLNKNPQHLPFCPPLRTVWDQCSRATVVDKRRLDAYCQTPTPISVDKLSFSNSHSRKQTPIFENRLPFSKTNSHFQQDKRWFSSQTQISL